MAKDFFIDILHIDLISKDNRSDIKFKELLKQQTKEYYRATPNYEIEFKTAYSNKRKYYQNRIDAETIKRFNTLVDTLDIQSTEAHLKYLFGKVYKSYTNYLTHISNYIIENSLNSELYLKPSNTSKSDEAYIIYYLKANAIMLLMELQDRFATYNEEPEYTQEEIHEKFFSEEAPTKLLVSPYSGSEIEIKKSIINKRGIFSAIKGDIESRPDNPKILSYAQIIVSAKQSALARLEETLNNEGIIDDKYNFDSKRGNKQKLAAFIIKLQKGNFFNERYFPENKIIEDKKITDFFAQRYGPNSDTDKQFRNFKGSERHKFNKLINQYSWLDKIS